MAYKMPVPTGSANADPACYLKISANWRHVLIGMIEAGLSDYFWDGTEEAVEAANAEVAKWLDDLEECEIVNDVALLQDRRSTGVNGGAVTTSAWTAITYANEIHKPTWLQTSGSQFLLLPGEYFLRANHQVNDVGLAMLRLYNVTASAQAAAGSNVLAQRTAGYSQGALAEVRARLSVAENTTYRIEYYATSTYSTGDLGFNLNAIAYECYGDLEITRL